MLPHVQEAACAPQWQLLSNQWLGTLVARTTDQLREDLEKLLSTQCSQATFGRRLRDAGEEGSMGEEEVC